MKDFWLCILGGINIGFSVYYFNFFEKSNTFENIVIGKFKHKFNLKLVLSMEYRT